MVPARVDDTQYGVAVGDFRHQNTHGAHVVYLGKIDPLALHFAPNGVDMLSSPAHVVAVNMLSLHQAFKGFHHVVNVSVAIQALFRQEFGDGLVILFM